MPRCGPVWLHLSASDRFQFAVPDFLHRFRGVELVREHVVADDVDVDVVDQVPFPASVCGEDAAVNLLDVFNRLGRTSSSWRV